MADVIYGNRERRRGDGCGRPPVAIPFVLVTQSERRGQLRHRLEGANGATDLDGSFTDGLLDRSEPTKEFMVFAARAEAAVPAGAGERTERALDPEES